MSFAMAFSLVVPGGLAAPSTASAEEGVSAFEKKFDFGPATGPVMEGFLPVGPADLYTAERGYGLDQEVNSRLRSGGTDLTNDFVLAPSFGFLADVPNGDYFVTVYSGDLLAGTSTTKLNVTLEGVAAGTVQARQSVSEATFRTTVADGQLTVGLSGSGGGGAYLNGLIVREAVPVPPAAPDSLAVAGVAVQPPSVTLRWNSVADAVSYNVYRSEGQEGQEGGGFAKLDQVSGTSYTDASVVAGGVYAYQVTAVNASGLESGASAPVSAEVPEAGEPPGDTEPLPSGWPLKLDFGPGETAEGYFGVRSPVAYSPELKYGFADPSAVVPGDAGTDDALRSDYLMPAGTTFNVDLPNGDYAVTVTAGDAGAATETSVSVEGMTASKIALTAKPAGEYLEQTFEVALVDGQLNLTFGGASPKINGLVIERLPERTAGETPTVYIAGDSTVQTYDPYWKPQAGWGQMIPRYFSAGVAFSNQAIGGRSSKSFLLEGRLDAILRAIKPGDSFLIQFGHNDATISIPERYASPADYKNYLKTYVEGARQRGATPILVTPVGRRDYNADTGRFNVSFPEYVAAMKELAEELDVPLVDLSALSREYYDTIGPEGTLAVFLHVPAGIYGAFPNGSQDNTHFQEYGAIQIARLLSGGIRELGLPLSSYVADTEPPAEAPAKPTGLTAGSVSNAGAVLRWNPVEGADIYKIYRKPSSETEYSLIGTATAPTITIQGMAEGQSYDVYVTAVNGRGESAPSDVVAIRMKQATLKFDFGLAGSPVMEGYTGVNLSTVYTPELGYGIVDPTGMIGRDRATGSDLLRDWLGYFNVGWKFNVDVPNGLYSVKLYVGDYLGSARTSVAIENVDYGTVSAGSRTIAEKVISQASVSDGQLSFAFGGATGIVNGLEITPILKAPSELRLEAKSTDPDRPSVSLAWTGVDDAAKYNVYRKVEGESKPALLGSATDEAYTDESADVGMTYVYQVTTVDAAGTETGPSAALAVSMVDPAVPIPEAPGSLAIGAVNKNDLSFAWEPSEGAKTYNVYRSEKADGPFARIGKSREASYTDTTVLTTIPYYYKVAAVSAGGVSELSETLETPAVTVLYRQAEYLDRAFVAVKREDGVYLGWRMLGTDPAGIAFNVYRDGVKLNAEPIAGATNLLDANGTASSSYVLKTVDAEGKERTASKETAVWETNHLAVPLQKPEGGITPAGEAYTYSANDTSVGDLDGDGVYELIVKWDPSNAHDNSQAGYTGNVYLDAYKLDGTRLWRIDLGKNIRAGAHYTQFMVYDLDGDGRAEVAFKTADGTVDGTGAVIGEASADHRNSSGYILQGPEYLTVFDGLTGRALTTADYDPPRGVVADWGDAYGNRVDRFLAAVAYLDGERPSLIFSRGYYTRTVIVAYDYKDGQLVKRWKFDTNDEDIGAAYTAQGDHNLSIGDVDRDGKDEITFGAMAIDDDGTPLYNTGLGHGDAQHLGDLDPSRPGLEFFNVHEHTDSPYGMDFRDAETGEVLWGVRTGIDTGRGMSADIDPNYLGEEVWAATITNEQHIPITGLYSAKGELISTAIPSSTNFGIWWDGDLSRELLDGNHIDKWDYDNKSTYRLFTAEGASSNNGTKATPNLQADLFGDWREEAVWRSADSSELRIYTTTDVTDTRLRTLMHDPIYRLGVAWQNVGYNQPPHTSFYLGTGMEEPPAPKIVVAGGPSSTDGEAPVTTASVEGESRNGWYRSAVQVKLEAADDGSGVEETFFRIDGGEAQTGTRATIDAEGRHTVEYWSVDRAGNEEEAKTLSVAIDLTPPTVEIQGQSEYTIDQRAAISYAATDAGSGVAEPHGSLLESEAYDLEPGLHRVTASVSDLAGNTTSVPFAFGVTATFDSLAALTARFAGGSEAPNADEVARELERKLEQAEQAAKEHRGAEARKLLEAYSRQVEAHSGKVFAAGQASVLKRWAAWLGQATPLANGAPGKPVLSDDNGHDTGLRDGDYAVTMNLWWGSNGTEFKLYENGELIRSATLSDESPAAQTVKTEIRGRGNGAYVYTCELINSFGTTKCDSLTVNVTDAAPGRPVLSHDNWDGDGSYRISANLWWGTNATRYALYENGTLVDSRELEAHTPNAQSAETAIGGRAPGTYEYAAVFGNEAGETRSATLKVTVSK
ncbi:rhamnogalacturonan lyase family protein [Cohnella xylanilytica]|uniref:rhamnogalacturonan lyase family protein n=1 Tax=Cohnella xylanilytica TaxID=557555 RepID=UPI0024848E38|nr:SGNH/GDSL hydrolase family protein [Cohnella xylanilytica]